ncbi:MAG: NAD(P)H-dependent oxidoreductase [Alphaproteobacteria bacterium]|nr:NAD(P)H-dependent oxidoreductase [Alphaproteobacteria bacterium]
MSLLYVDACIRKDSRTRKLAEYLLSKIGKDYKKIGLANSKISYIDEEYLQKRDAYIRQGNFDDPMFGYAKEFAKADEIVIAAPYWDLSFCSLLKIFVEHVNVLRLVFDYSANGEIVSLCKAKKLYYVTTKGGFGGDDFGYEYIKMLCKTFYGIKDVVLIKAEGLDSGLEPEKVLNQAKVEMERVLESGC